MLRVTFFDDLSHSNVAENPHVGTYIGMYDILKRETVDLTTHVQIIIQRYDTPTNPNSYAYCKGRK